jgi:hypothetical protein
MPLWDQSRSIFGRCCSINSAGGFGGVGGGGAMSFHWSPHREDCMIAVYTEYLA